MGKFPAVRGSAILIARNKLGFGLTVAGAVFAGLAYFVMDSTPLASLGISAVFVGAVWLSLTNSHARVSQEFARMLIETGEDSIAALFEELEIESKAVYLPASLGEGRALTLVPLPAQAASRRVDEGKTPGRIVRYGGSPGSVALAITTCGTVAVRYLEARPELTEDNLGAAMTEILHSVLDIAAAAAVSLGDNRAVVEIHGVASGDADAPYYRYLGSPSASIAAAIMCEAFNAPVRIEEESRRGATISVTLEVVP